MMELEIKVLWCKGLTAGAFNFFQKLAVYAAVSITPDDKTLKLTQDEQQEQKTPIDQEGDGSPEWNYTMKFNLGSQNISSNLHHLSLLFELRTLGHLFGEKGIGEVRVPLKELVHSGGNGVARLVSYEVRCHDGKHNGVLDFSYKVMGGANLGLESQFKIEGYEHRYHHHHHHQQESYNNHSGSASDPGRIEYSNTSTFVGNCVSDSHIQTSSYGHLHQESHISSNGHFGHCVSDSGIQVSAYRYHSHQESHVANNGQLGHCVSDSGIQTSGYGYHSHQESHVSDSSMSSVVSERIQYPQVDYQPPPPPVHYPPPSQPLPPPVYYPPTSQPPPPPPPRFPEAPPRDQQPYAYQPPPYGVPYSGYARPPPPNYQQTRGGGYEYPHW